MNSMLYKLHFNPTQTFPQKFKHQYGAVLEKLHSFRSHLHLFNFNFPQLTLKRKQISTISFSCFQEKNRQDTV